MFRKDGDYRPNIFFISLSLSSISEWCTMYRIPF